MDMKFISIKSHFTIEPQENEINNITSNNVKKLVSTSFEIYSLSLLCDHKI